MNMHSFSNRASIAIAAVFVGCCALPVLAQGRRNLITQPIDDSRRHTLAGNTRPEVRLAIDRGSVESDTAMDHMILQLSRSASGEQALKEHIDSLHDLSSPRFHQWMTAAEFGQAYGASAEDRAMVTAWLESKVLP